jgi:hypothetical protein
MGDHAVVTRHEFLAKLHDVIRPRTYLEVGVQSGASLALAQGTVTAIGVDPHPALSVGVPFWAKIHEQTSDEFFTLTAKRVLKDPIDLAFIDGMHLWEFALRDFMNIEKFASPDGTIVFDDVLPYNREIATREQPPGDWTGDVWKVVKILEGWRPDLNLRLVDAKPTGLLVIRNLDPDSQKLKRNWASINENYGPLELPDDILDRRHAQDSDAVLSWVEDDLLYRAERRPI